MNKLWSDDGWEHYVYWQNQDKKTLNRINKLIKDIERNGLSVGIGKPEKLLYSEGYTTSIGSISKSRMNGPLIEKAFSNPFSTSLIEFILIASIP